MVDPQVMELGKVMSNAIVSNFFKIIFPIMIIGGVINLLVTLIFKKKEKKR